MKTSEQIDLISTARGGKIFQTIPKIMAAMGAIGKGRNNQAQGYKFRGVDDVYNALQHHLAEQGVFTVPEVLEERTEDRTTAKGSALIYRVLKIKFTFYADDGSSFSAVTIGEGMDSGDKASNKAMSVGHKYALLQVFCVPTEEPKDPENDSHQVAPKLDPRMQTPAAAPIFIASVEQKEKLAALFDELKILPAWREVMMKELMGKPLSFIRGYVTKRKEEMM